MRLLLSTFLTFLFAISNITAQDLTLFKAETYKDKQGNTMPYRILLPRSYDANKSYPLLLFLHGMGERGDDNTTQLNHIAPFLLSEYEKGDNEVIVILPQCPVNDMWISEQLRNNLKSTTDLYLNKDYPQTNALKLAEEILDSMLLLPQVDSKQVSIMGLSMGGFGTLDLLSRRPDTFIKAAPICGGGILAFAHRYSPHTDIWLFHGSDDNIVPTDLSRALYDKLLALDANVYYTEYAGVDHGSWFNAFNEPELMRWLTTPSDKTRYNTLENIQYYDDNSDPYIANRCKLDIYYPTNKSQYSTIVWFHGGGLEGGSKFIPKELTEKGIAVVSVNYRLSNKATAPAYIEDAAAAVAWTLENIEQYGGDSKKVFVSGHSAGAYLALMVAFDKDYLQAHNLSPDHIRGLIPISGQTITHNAIRKEMQLPNDIPVVDKYAPINKVRHNLPPTLLITGDRNKELISRFEENLYLESVMRYMKNDVTLYELQGFDHGSVLQPSYVLLLEWMEKILNK